MSDEYGHRSAIERYIGATVEGWIPHGFFPGGMHRTEAELAAGRTVLCWQPHMDDAYREIGCKVIPIAAPFCYAAHRTKASGDYGIIAFPTHNTEGMGIDAEWDKVARECRVALANTVCLYHLDLPHRHHFEALGMQVVTCGAPNADGFMERLAGYLKGSRYAISNEASSNLLYAQSVLVPYLVTGRAPNLVRCDTAIQDDPYQERCRVIQRQMREHYHRPLLDTPYAKHYCRMDVETPEAVRARLAG